MLPPVSFRGRPQTWTSHLKLSLAWTRRLFDLPDFRSALAPYLDCLGVDPDHALVACRKAAAVLLGEDAKKAALANEEGAITADCPQWLAAVEPQRSLLLSPTKRARTAAVLALWWARLLVDILRRGGALTPAAPAAILFDQYYGIMDDQEFLAFYRYFKTRSDVVYNCPDRGEKFRFLEREGRQPRVHRWSVAWSRVPAELYRLARLGRLFAFDHSMPTPFKIAVARLFRDRMRYESLLDALPCRRFLRVRFDMDASHPLVTALCEARGIHHTGYSCGSYPEPTLLYAAIDFHEYGLLGRGFKDDIYKDLWPDAIRYGILGPFTAELEPGPPKERSAGTVLGLFPTSYGDEFYMQRSFFDEFVEAAIAAASTAGASLFIKVKDRSASNATSLKTACRGRVRLDFAYNDDWDGRPARRTPDVIAACDVAVVMGASTAAWEALAAGRKVLVYEQPWRRHPFESVEPRLVVKDPAALTHAVAWILALPKAEHDALVEPVIARWAKRSDGRLVRDFIESLENDH